jgi:hypothetical protein
MVGKKRTKKFNISNKLAYTLIVIALIIGLGIGVLAYGTSSPSTMGHSLGEISMPACSNGQVLGMVSGAWACVTPSAGSTDNCRFCNQGCGGEYTAERGFWVVGTTSNTIYSGRYDGTCTTWLEGYMQGARIYLCCKP